jgi:hypothetical protein
MGTDGLRLPTVGYANDGNWRAMFQRQVSSVPGHYEVLKLSHPNTPYTPFPFTRWCSLSGRESTRLVIA